MWIQINKLARVASLFGLCPIPFADIPIIVALELVLIKYAAKIYEINTNEVNVTRLLTIGPTDNASVIILNSVGQILRLSHFFDIIPIIGMGISVVANYGTVKAFGEAIKRHFGNLLTNEKLPSIINDILKDYRSIYLQRRDDLCRREIFNIDN